MRIISFFYITSSAAKSIEQKTKLAIESTTKFLRTNPSRKAIVDQPYILNEVQEALENHLLVTTKRKGMLQRASW
jgi:hypothetical protein